jgi:hypothetical protein
VSRRSRRENGYLEGINEFRGTDVYGHPAADNVVALCTRAARASARGACLASPKTSTRM